MPNPFDQFDQSPAAGAVANPFDQFDQAPPTPKEKEKTWYDELARQAGLTARAAITGATALPNMAGNAINSAINLGTKGINKVAGTNIPQMQMTSQATQNLMNQAGIPQPKDSTERVVQDMASAVSGGGSMAKLAGMAGGAASSPAAKEILSKLAQGPGMQATAGATGAGAAGTARENGVGVGGQLAAGLAGSLAPAAAVAGAPLALKTLLRGTEANLPAMAERAATFRDAGARAPSVGQVSGSRTSQAVESALSKIPGGAGPMAKAAEIEAAEIGQKATRIADSLSSIGNPVNAGLAIEKGISGEGGFIPRFKEAQKALYSKVDQFIPKNLNVDVSNTKNTLAAMNSDIKGAPAISQWFKNAKIQGIEAALKSDTGGTPATASPILQSSGAPFKKPGAAGTDAIPYTALKQLRTLVGAELESNSLVSDVPRSKWKQLYASLSQDMDKAAASTGNPEAIKAAQRANNFTRAGYQRIEDVLDKVTSSGTPEQIYKKATSAVDMEAGATKIASIMKSLQPAERDVVKSAFIRRMGKATAGNQGADGDTFSSQTFLTNWNKMSPQAKAVMFSGKDGETAASLNQIAKAAQYIKEGSKVFSNPSGTSPGMAQLGAVTGVASALATGRLGTAALLLGGAGSANISAKLMTNPKFVSWLAKSTEMPPGAIPAAITALGKSMSNEDPDVQNAALDYAASVMDKVKNPSPAPVPPIQPISKLIKNTEP